jgi:hypothetical protein
VVRIDPTSDPCLGLRDGDGDCVFAGGHRRQVPFLGGLGAEHFDGAGRDELLVVEELCGVGTDPPDGLDTQHRGQFWHPAATVLLGDIEAEKAAIGQEFDVPPRRVASPLEDAAGELRRGNLLQGLDHESLFRREFWHRFRPRHETC